ncbi:uncharacterized protein LOC115310953 [Ixodes scapularis]|uniref:uncharacterized protein LOC115310953 n=1 Tax=Ixodes scapularis TaxID=6945 RepID=UPI001A9CBF57|nr:uncharacterized protein LOC115310953 [Ixodes scapularis]
MRGAAHQGESLPCTTYPATRCDAGVLQKSALPAACLSTAAATKNSSAQRPPPGACQVSAGPAGPARPAGPAGPEAVAAKSPAPVPPAFTHLPDGTFHLTKGIVISSGQAAKIFRGKKPTIVGKETAQAIWTNAVLATRSVTGTTCPQKRAAGEPAKPPLTPEKIDVVQAAISFWGDQNKQSAAAAAVVCDIGNLLREKCQDARRSEERLKKKL